MHDPIASVWAVLQPPPGTFLNWFLRGCPPLGGTLADHDSLQGFARRYGTNDCYIGLNPTSTQAKPRASADDIGFIRGLVIDIDPVCSPASPDIERIVAHAENLLGIGLNPDRVDSGRGRQLWLRFDPVPVPTQEEKSQWRRAVGAFLHRLDQDLGVVGGCRIDTSCCDLPRLVRLPGTINTKTGRTAQFLGIGQADSRIRTSILERFGVSSAPQRPTSQCARDNWKPLFHMLSGRAKAFLSAGCGEPGRHAAAFATAASMRDLGASYEATERAVLLGAGKCSPPLSTYEATRCVRNAFKEGLIGS